MVVDFKIKSMSQTPILLFIILEIQSGSCKIMTMLSPTIKISCIKKAAQQPTLKFFNLEEFLFTLRKGIKTGKRMNNLTELSLMKSKKTLLLPLPST